MDGAREEKLSFSIDNEWPAIISDCHLLSLIIAPVVGRLVCMGGGNNGQWNSNGNEKKFGSWHNNVEIVYEEWGNGWKLKEVKCYWNDKKIVQAGPLFLDARVYQKLFREFHQWHAIVEKVTHEYIRC